MSEKMMFSWDSEALGDVYSGTVCVLAETVDEARKNALETFKDHHRSRDKSALSQFEADIAREPETHDVCLITSY